MEIGEIVVAFRFPHFFFRRGENPRGIACICGDVPQVAAKSPQRQNGPGEILNKIEKIQKSKTKFKSLFLWVCFKKTFPKTLHLSHPTTLPLGNLYLRGGSEPRQPTLSHPEPLATSQVALPAVKESIGTTAAVRMTWSAAAVVLSTSDSLPALICLFGKTRLNDDSIWKTWGLLPIHPISLLKKIESKPLFQTETNVIGRNYTARLGGYYRRETSSSHWIYLQSK